MAEKFIDAVSTKSAIKKVCEAYNIAFENGQSGFGDMLAGTIDNMPAADVQEVRHGEWKERMSCSSSVKCSVCGNSHEYETTYCPNCGARMDGDPNA